MLALTSLVIAGKIIAVTAGSFITVSSGPKAIVPSGGERFRVGDVVALAGTTEAVDSTKALLTGARRAADGRLEVPADSFRVPEGRAVGQDSN